MNDRIPFFAIILLFFLNINSTFAQKDVTIFQKDDSGVLFRYSPTKITRQAIQIEERVFTRYQIYATTVQSHPGEPEIPVRTIIFAVPEHAEVLATLVRDEYSEETGIDLLPIAVWESGAKIPVARYPATYQLQNRNSWFPQTILEIEKPAYLNDYRIVRVHIVPLQYLPDKKIVRIHHNIVVKLRFTGRRTSRSGLSEKQSAISRSIYSRFFANPEQAEKWVHRRSKPRVQKLKKYYSGSDYYKIPIETEGLYRITGKFLQNNGIDILNIQPGTLKIFNNGGQVLPQNIRESRPDSLIENPILVVDGGDGRFDPEDYLLFYAKGVTGWKYSSQEQRLLHYINPYTNTNIYWLTFNDNLTGKRMQPAIMPETVTRTITTYQARQFIEDEMYNLFHSGLVWFGTKFDDQARTSRFVLNLKNLVPADTISLRARLFSSSGNSHQFNFIFDDQNLGSVSYYGSRDYQVEFKKAVTITGTRHALEIQYTPSTPIAVSFLDWFEITAEATLELDNNGLIFYTERGSQGVEYKIGEATESQYYILDVTDISDTRQVTDYSVNNDMITFGLQLSDSVPRRIAVFGRSKIQDVPNISKDEPSDLHDPGNGADFIIITHNDFYNAASSLKNLRESHDGLQTKIVKIDDVYDEFSAGLFDPTAIRDFLKYVYDHWSPRPQYVLLFGDGDYDYKNLVSKNDSNWIPPYETRHLNDIDNRTTDDWFTYVHGDDSMMDYSIGRIPVQTTEEAEFVVEKLIEYSTNPPPGFWKNLFTMIADDEMVEGGRGNETIHTYDAEDLMENYVPRRFDLEKIYLTEYPVVYDASASWLSKPKATEDLISRINQGSLVINFIGHGNPHLWTHERILKDSRDVNKIQNGSRYGFWITATCDFGRWDDPEGDSFAEVLLKMQGRGAVCMLSSARLGYASPNASFNKQYVKILLQNTGRSLRVGDAMVLAKMNTYNLTNNEKFHILGDPTLALAVPPYNVEITDLVPDSLKALSLITVKGKILDPYNQETDVTGEVFVKTFDSRKDVTYFTRAGSRLEYKLPGNPIFRGSGAAENGRFEIQFIVPKDISYGGTSGRISIYFDNDQVDGVGYRSNLIVDGTVTNFADDQGPDIEFEAQNQSLIDYAVLNQNEVLTVLLEDDRSGINITGDVGHKIIAIPDQETGDQKEITPLFEYEPNSYLRGTLPLPLSLFPEFQNAGRSSGMHQLTIKAWDNANNSSRKTIQFEVIPEGELVLKDVLNFPNPFFSSTTFTFYLNADAEVNVKIYTLAGRLITHLSDFSGSFGFNMIPWDGRDQDGDAISNGVYLYKITARKQEQSVEEIGKLIKMK